MKYNRKPFYEDTITGSLLAGILVFVLLIVLANVVLTMTTSGSVWVPVVSLAGGTAVTSLLELKARPSLRIAPGWGWDRFEHDEEMTALAEAAKQRAIDAGKTASDYGIDLEFLRGQYRRMFRLGVARAHDLGRSHVRFGLLTNEWTFPDEAEEAWVVTTRAISFAFEDVRVEAERSEFRVPLGYESVEVPWLHRPA